MADEVDAEFLGTELERIVVREGALAAVSFFMLPLPGNHFHIIVAEAGATEADRARLLKHLSDKFAKVRELT